MPSAAIKGGELFSKHRQQRTIERVNRRDGGNEKEKAKEVGISTVINNVKAWQQPPNVPVGAGQWFAWRAVTRARPCDVPPSFSQEKLTASMLSTFKFDSLLNIHSTSNNPEIACIWYSKLFTQQTADMVQLALCTEFIYSFSFRWEQTPKPLTNSYLFFPISFNPATVRQLDIRPILVPTYFSDYQKAKYCHSRELASILVAQV